MEHNLDKIATTNGIKQASGETIDEFRERVTNTMEQATKQQNEFTPYPPFRGNTQEFETTEELLQLDYVKQFAEYGNFHQFSVSETRNVRYDAPELLLMAEYNGGKGWGVIGYIKRAEGVNLPKREAKHDAT